MVWGKWLEEKSALATALDLVGDKWTLFIITDCIAGHRRFNKIERHLGINRNLLKSRLDRLIGAGLLTREPISEGSRQYEYVPTDMCMELRPVIVGLARWAEEFITKDETPLTSIHTLCGGELKTIMFCNKCEQQVMLNDVDVRVNPGAGEETTRYAAEKNM